MKLTTQQQKLIQPMVVFGWKAYHHTRTNSKTAYWDDDPLMPVRIGPVMESLVAANLVERLDSIVGYGIVIYRLVAERRSQYQCGCSKGKIIDEDDNEIGKCSHCYHGCLKLPKVR